MYTNPASIKLLRHGLLLIFTIIMLAFSSNNVAAQENGLVIRIAKLVIDSAQLENYKAALKEGAETAVLKEPGVLSLYAVYDKANPANVTVFEIYANAAAYQSHLQTPHFKKYKETTKDMVQSLELLDVVPIALASKPGR